MKNKENHPLAPLAFILQTDFKMLKIIGVVAPRVRMRTPFAGLGRVWGEMTLMEFGGLFQIIWMYLFLVTF